MPLAPLRRVRMHSALRCCAVLYGVGSLSSRRGQGWIRGTSEVAPEAGRQAIAGV